MAERIAWLGLLVCGGGAVYASVHVRAGLPLRDLRCTLSPILPRSMSRLFRDVEGGPLCPQGSVVCIGAFDGLHLGHRALVRHAAARARDLGVPLVALSFEPLPREFFARVKPPRLLLPRAKIEGLCALGADRVGLLRFDARLAAMRPSTSCAKCWCGGSARAKSGSARVPLRQGQGGRYRPAAGSAASRLHRAVRSRRCCYDGERVSSTRIRAALAAGDFAAAARLLGRRLRHRGPRGARPPARAHAWLPDREPALRRQGAGAVAASTRRCVHGVGARPRPAVSSFGTRPTVDGVEPLLEAHLFDFDGDLYGRRIEVEFVAKLRDEQKFPDLPALVAQMHRDAATGARLLIDEPRATRDRA